MHMLHHQNDLAHQKPSILMRKCIRFGNDIKEILTLDKIHNEVYKIGVFD